MVNVRSRLIVTLAAALASANAGCSSLDGMMGGSSASSPSPSAASRFTAMFSSSPAANANAEATGAGVPGEEPICPQVDVRTGASTFAQSTATTGDPNALALRYQATIGQTARECQQGPGSITMRVGVQGRVILGPAGAPGNVDLPLRFAVVQEGPDPKTIMTKLHRIAVAVPEGQTNVPFTHIEEGISFPVPSRVAAESYIVYVGYDPLAAKPEPKKPAKPQRKPPQRG